MRPPDWHNLSDAKKDLWYRLEQIGLTAMNADVAREDVVVALIRHIERKSTTTEFESLVRRVCKYD